MADKQQSSQKLILRLKNLFKNKKFTWASLVLMFLALASVAYLYINRGFMISETASKVTAYARTYVPDDSYIYENSISPKSFRIVYDESVAKGELAHNNVTSGISIYPDIRGKWYFSGDRDLSFTPEKDWIPNTKYTVKLSGEIFSPEFVVKDKEFTFNSPEFKVQKERDEFYEDPIDTKKKQAVATFIFNYPIDTQDLKNYVSVKTIGGDKYDFTVKRDDEHINKIHIMSESLKIKAVEDFVEIKVSGVKNAYNGEKIKNEAVAKIKIPSSSTFFKISSINTDIIKNENNNNQPEQILFINFSTSVDSRELIEYVEFYSKNDYCYNFNDKLSKVKTPLEISGVKKLDVEKLSSEGGKNHMFKYDIKDLNSCIIVKIKKGLGSKDGFILANDEVVNLSSADYPMEAKIAFEGSILSLEGDKKLALSSRGVDRLDVQVARINSKDINHLVSQTSGNFSHPYFRNYSFDEANISEIFDETKKINMEHPSKLNYSSVDLNKYFKQKKGIFLIRVNGYYQNRYTTSDSRLVVITGTGIIVKDNLDKTHDVFVSSFANGSPINGAKVEVLGKNGIPVLEGYTNSQGMVSFPDYKDFLKDKEPVVYLVNKDGDISYMPINKYDRKLDFSRFDVEGIYESKEDNRITGYAFSDRGIYRPGENAYFGLMVRSSDLSVPNKLPMKLTVRNPNGDEVANKKLWVNEFGYLDFKYFISNTAPVGPYTLSLYDESKEYSSYITSVDFKVEEFTPDTMKINLKLENAKTKGWYNLPELKAEVDLQNLYGNPSVGHNIRANILMSPTSFRFKEYEGYNFRDPLRDNNNSYIRSYNEELSDLQTNEKGIANYNIDINKFDKGTYTLRLSVEGFELDGGRGVSTASSILVSPLDYIVGYKADGNLYDIKKNSVRNVNFIVIDNELNKTTKDGLTLELVETKYISSLMQMPNGTYKYQMVPREEFVSSENVTIFDKGLNISLATSKSGSFHYLLKDAKGEVVSRFDYTVEGAENTNFALDKDANLSVTLDKKEYNHGDYIKLKIVAPYEGYGLITIERDKTYTYKWFKADKKTTTETIRLPYTVEGNAYINVAFVRDINSKEIFISPLSYAVVPFGINKEARTINIDLEVPEVVKPGHDLVVKYKTSKSGKIVVYGVNQGILQVAKYKMPNPLSEFMKKKALRVSTYQIMDLIMPEMNLVLNYSAAGGDEEMEMNDLPNQFNPFARKQNEVVAFWSGVIDADGLGEYTYKVPEIFNGQIKVMAVAVSETSFGSAEKDTYIRGDFALTPSGPFNVIPGDEFEVGTSVANLVDNSGDNYEVNVSVEPTDGLEIVGDKAQVVKIREGGATSVRFKVKATDKLGSSTLRFTAQAVKDSSKSVSMPYHIGIRPATPYLTALTMGYETSKVKLKDFVIPMFAEYRQQEVLASNSPLVLGEGLVQYLDKFPHWCTEQAISKVYPAIVLLFKQPELVKGIDVYALFDNVIAKLGERQTLDGSFSPWSRSNSSGSEYLSLYAFDFLSVASNRGFNVPKGMLDKVRDYVKSVAARDINSESDANVAYAIYLLTRDGEVTTNYILNTEQYLENNYKKTWKSTLSGTYLAASYKLLQNDTKASGLLGNYKFGKNSDTDDARYIYLMATYFADDFKDLGQKPVQALLKPLKNKSFTTNSAAYSLLALSAYDLSSDKDITFVGKDAVYGAFAQVDVSVADKTLEIKSEKPFFYVVSEQGYQSAPVAKSYSNFIELTKQYLDKKGKVVEKAKIGDEITVKITIRTTGGKVSINDIAITDLIAGCFEMIRDSISSSTYLDNKEEREDRALIYLTADKVTREITYKVKVIAEGEFVSPAVFAQALYDSDVKANTVASTFTAEE